MRTFDSIDDIKNASVEKLSSIPELNERIAQTIYDYFHAEET